MHVHVLIRSAFTRSVVGDVFGGGRVPALGAPSSSRTVVQKNEENVNREVKLKVIRQKAKLCYIPWTNHHCLKGDGGHVEFQTGVLGIVTRERAPAPILSFFFSALTI